MLQLLVLPPLVCGSGVCTISVRAQTCMLCAQVQELMGAEEASMVEFVMSQLNDHTPPAKMHEELAPVLDDEADAFVLKLYRMVIFETQKHAQGLQEST